MEIKFSDDIRTVYKGTVGKTISLEIDDNGSPLNLTNATVKLYLYAEGTDLLLWTGGRSCTVDSAPNGLCHYDTIAGDLATVGSYYLMVEIIIVAPSVPATLYEQGVGLEIIEKEPRLVPPEEFIDWLGIPQENAKANAVLNIFLDDAEAQLYVDVPALRTTSDKRYLKEKKRLIKLRAGIDYFMNADENLINPNLREPKIKMWKEEYNNSVDMLVSQLGTANGLIRRIKSSSYSDISSRDYDG